MRILSFGISVSSEHALLFVIDPKDNFLLALPVSPGYFRILWYTVSLQRRRHTWQRNEWAASLPHQRGSAGSTPENKKHLPYPALAEDTVSVLNEQRRKVGNSPWVSCPPNGGPISPDSVLAGTIQR